MIEPAVIEAGAGTGVRRLPRVVRNDWSQVRAPDLEGWRPTLTLSVVIPAYQCQSTLDLTLASLSQQTYPADLLEVVVVDDGSDPPLTLPPIRPEGTKLVQVGDSGWGRANALRYGVAHSSGEILHWLDADMVAFPEHVAAQARWQHVLPYAVTLGYKRFVDPAEQGPWPSPDTVAQQWRRGAAAELFGGDPGEPHAYVERYIAQTDQLRTADHLAFRIHVGATAALHRDLYEAAGGLDPRLRLGEDTEFGYRLAQAGAVFVPEPQARSWHLGRTQVMRAREQVARYNRPFLADRVPYPRHWRKVGGPTWSVPLAEVVMEVEPVREVERVRAAVDSVLRGTEPDIRVNLVGPWDQLGDAGQSAGAAVGQSAGAARVSPLADPLLDLRLIAASYQGEPRVRLVTEPPASAFPAPYLLELPVRYGLAPDALRRLIDMADRHQAGVVRVHPPATAAGAGPPVLLWRTAARGRAEWVRAEGESLLAAVSEVHGSREVSAAAVGVADLAPFSPEELATGSAAVSAALTARGRGMIVPATVEVMGVRTWAQATLLVASLAYRRLRSGFRSGFRSGLLSKVRPRRPG